MWAGRIFMNIHPQLRTFSILARTLSCILPVFCIILGSQIKKKERAKACQRLAEASSPKSTDIVFDL